MIHDGFYMDGGLSKVMTAFAKIPTGGKHVFLDSKNATRCVLHASLPSDTLYRVPCQLAQ